MRSPKRGERGAAMAIIMVEVGLILVIFLLAQSSRCYKKLI